MKVSIGKYPIWRWYSNFLYETFGHSPKQKVQVKLDDHDTWSMDHTLAQIALPMLYQLAKTKHGSPLVDIEDVPFELQGDYEDVVHDRWDWVMSEMIFAFESKVSDDDWQSQFYSGEHDTEYVPILDSHGNEVAYEQVKGANDTFKVDYEGLKVYQARIDKGFLFFGKYYSGLWD
tara:strand:+ start:147 stop:671 length:525 start_codon:yes stop_codon:yes gene_type:complete